MKNKIRLPCPECKGSKNFYLIKLKGIYFYHCNGKTKNKRCNVMFPLIENLKKNKKIELEC